MATPPILYGATYYDKFIVIAVKPIDQNVATTELADAFAGESFSRMAPIDTGLFTVKADGVTIPVLSADMHKNAILTLSKSIKPNAKVTVSYNAPTTDQEKGVLQDSEGEDAASAILNAEYTAGFTTKLLDGAELGGRFGVDDRDWYYGNQNGFYVASSGEAGGQPDTPITVISTTNKTFVVEIKPTKYFANPSYSLEAISGFRSYKFSNELTSGEFLKNGRDIKVGDTFNLLDLVDPEKGEKSVWMKTSVMTTNNNVRIEPERVFDISYSQAKAGSQTFWLGLSSWMYGYKGVDFNENVLGSSYADTIATGSGNDIIDGGAGEDIIDGGAGNDAIKGGIGGDELTGGSGADLLDGGQGDDVLYSGDGNDSVSAGDGADIIIGGDGAGNDTYDGGKGVDAVKYTSAKAGITVDLLKGTATSTAGSDAAGIGTDKLKNIENIIGGDYADLLIGSKESNSIAGGFGNDIIDGGLGNDTLSGGAGADVFIFSTKPAANNVDTIDFQAGIDKIQLSSKVFAKLKGASDYLAPGSVSTSVTHYLAYDSGTGKLSYDADGSATKIKPVDIAIIGTGLTLTIGDFLVV